ncbi:MAG: sugar ABC transporter substrate-binding protein [Aestuariivirga sp.]|uniref:sugar ABC transporter substrate-binding protein n=1 Tax=Aestuariivirga sp. TaxID=2650926 RepID=UPI0025C4835E|nr:sugar ABC transporter substrate-binding protein [Aestuariivirga sp.]MCA3562155.1 sugar ABC transporter substrate-binding protein [Aestuariivirga sp.]
MGGSNVKSSLKAVLLGAAATALFSAGEAHAGVGACLITKTETNPFFVKMREGAAAKAAELGIDLKAYAGKDDGDNEGQVAAIETCMADGVKGILITPSDTKAIVPSIKKARDAGILVIALDTPLEPIDAADQTMATDNFQAGFLIGAYAKAKLGDAAKDAKIGFLNINPKQVTVDVLRNQGFMKGFGIDVKDPNVIGDEDDPRIVGNDYTNGNPEGGRKAMENLLQINPDINVIHTINEPAAAGAYEALKAVGKENQVLIMSVDGGCPGVKDVAAGIIGGTSQQYPLLMASMGVEAIKKFADTGEKPKATEGKNFFDTGVQLITDKPVDGVPSIDTKKGLELCWG